MNQLPKTLPEPPSEQELEEAYRNIPKSSRVGSVENPKGSFDPIIPEILPHEQVFQIQVGERLFKLSGASLSSDAPSYFTTFFLKHKNLPSHEWPILYIDRSPKLFSLIVAHLQGYYVMPDNDVEFVYLLLDANYYHLPRLIQQLAMSEIHVRIGSQSFKISRTIFNNPGDSPNFFSLGFSTFFGSEIAPPSKSFKRPPPLAPPTVAHRSGDLFRDLLTVLQGSQLHIRDDEHRMLLLNECRYYRFLGLEQKLISHSIHTNRMRQTEEIVIGLNDIRMKTMVLKDIPLMLTPKSLLNSQTHPNNNNQQTQQPSLNNKSQKLYSVFYKRPYADTKERELVIQLRDSDTSYCEAVVLFRSATGQWEAVFFDAANTKLKNIMDTLLASARKRALTLAHQAAAATAAASSSTGTGTSTSSTNSSVAGSPVTLGNSGGSLDLGLSPQSTPTPSSGNINKDNTTYIKIEEDSPSSTKKQYTSSSSSSSLYTGDESFQGGGSNNTPLTIQPPTPVVIPRGPRNGYIICTDDSHVVLNGKPIDPNAVRGGNSSNNNNNNRGQSGTIASCPVVTSSGSNSQELNSQTLPTDQLNNLLPNSVSTSGSTSEGYPLKKRQRIDSTSSSSSSNTGDSNITANNTTTTTTTTNNNTNTNSIGNGTLGSQNIMGPGTCPPLRMILTKSQWRILQYGNQIILELLRGEGHCGQRYVNATRGFI